VQPLGPNDFGPFVRREIANWKRVVKETGIQPE